MSEFVVRRLGEDFVAESAKYGVMVTGATEEQVIADCQAAVEEAKKADAGKPDWWADGIKVVNRTGKGAVLSRTPRGWRAVTSDGLTTWVNPDPMEWTPLPSSCLTRMQVKRVAYDAKRALMVAVGRPVPEWAHIHESSRQSIPIDTRGDHELGALLGIVGGAIETALNPYCNE